MLVGWNGWNFKLLFLSFDDYLNFLKYVVEKLFNLLIVPLLTKTFIVTNPYKIHMPQKKRRKRKWTLQILQTDSDLKFFLSSILALSDSNLFCKWFFINKNWAIKSNIQVIWSLVERKCRLYKKEYSNTDIWYKKFSQFVEFLKPFIYFIFLVKKKLK